MKRCHPSRGHRAVRSATDLNYPHVGGALRTMRTVGVSFLPTAPESSR